MIYYHPIGKDSGGAMVEVLEKIYLDPFQDTHPLTSCIFASQIWEILEKIYLVSLISTRARFPGRGYRESAIQAAFQVRQL
ncbi:hypothetical protein ACTXT7_009687 [Hymenolepis weldensis]